MLEMEVKKGEDEELEEVRKYGKGPQQGLYTATYSGVTVWEIHVQGIDVMRRCSDSWLNATQLLKVAQIDKPQRTKILEREIQTGTHEKVQGGYGKYQGTWVPYARGVEIAQQYGVHSFISQLLDFNPLTDQAPPIIPKRQSYVPVKQEKRVIKSSSSAKSPSPVSRKPRIPHLEWRDEMIQGLLDRTKIPPLLLKQPLNWSPTIPLDSQGHTALHWAAALSRIDCVTRLLNLHHAPHMFASDGCTPLMWAVRFDDNLVMGGFRNLLHLLSPTHALDPNNRTILHHIVLVTSGDVSKIPAAEQYMNLVLNHINDPGNPISSTFYEQEQKRKREEDERELARIRFVNHKDNDGNTALDLAVIEQRPSLVKILSRNGAIGLEQSDDEFPVRRLRDDDGNYVYIGCCAKDILHNSPTNPLVLKNTDLLKGSTKSHDVLANALGRINEIQSFLESLKSVPESEEIKTIVHDLRIRLVGITASVYSVDPKDIVMDALQSFEDNLQSTMTRIIETNRNASQSDKYRFLVSQCLGLPEKKVENILDNLIDALNPDC